MDLYQNATPTEVKTGSYCTMTYTPMSDKPTFFSILIKGAALPNFYLEAQGNKFCCKWIAHSLTTGETFESVLKSKQLPEIMEKLLAEVNTFPEDYTFYVVEVSRANLPPLPISVRDKLLGSIRKRALVKEIIVAAQPSIASLIDKLDRTADDGFSSFDSVRVTRDFQYELLPTLCKYLSKRQNLVNLSFDMINARDLALLQSLCQLKVLEVRTFQYDPLNHVDCKELFVDVLKCASIHVLDLLRVLDPVKVSEVHITDPNPELYWCTHSFMDKERLRELLDKVTVVRASPKFLSTYLGVTESWRTRTVCTSPTSRGINFSYEGVIHKLPLPTILDPLHESNVTHIEIRPTGDTSTPQGVVCHPHLKELRYKCVSKHREEYGAEEYDLVVDFRID